MSTVNPINKDEAYISLLDGDMKGNYTVSDFVKMGIKDGNIEIHLPNSYTLHETLKDETLFEHLDRMEQTPPEPVELNELGQLPPPPNVPFIRQTQVEGEGFTMRKDIDRSIYDFFTHDPGGNYEIMNPDGTVREKVERGDRETGMKGISDEMAPEIKHEYYQEQLQYLRSTRHAPDPSRPRVAVIGDNPAFDREYDAADFDKWLKALNQAGYEGKVEYDVLDQNDKVIYHGRQSYDEDFQKKVKNANPQYEKQKERETTYQEDVKHAHENTQAYAEENPGPEVEMEGYPAPGEDEGLVPPALHQMAKMTFQTAKDFLKAERRSRKENYYNAMKLLAERWSNSYLPSDIPPMETKTYKVRINTPGQTLQADIKSGRTVDSDGKESSIDKAMATYAELPRGGKIGFRRMLERAAREEYQLVNLKDYNVSIEHFGHGRTAVSLVDENNHLFTYEADGDKLKKHDQYVIFKDGKALESAKDSATAYKKLNSLRDETRAATGRDPGKDRASGARDRDPEPDRPRAATYQR